MSSLRPSATPIHHAANAAWLRAKSRGLLPSQIRGTHLAVHPGVTLRISTRRDGSREVVTVDGRLDADAVVELERMVAELSPPLCLDLVGLKSVDEVGLGVLRALLAHGVAVTGASPYVRLLLELEEPKKPDEPPSRPSGRKRIGE